MAKKRGYGLRGVWSSVTFECNYGNCPHADLSLMGNLLKTNNLQIVNY